MSGFTELHFFQGVAGDMFGLQAAHGALGAQPGLQHPPL